MVSTDALYKEWQDLQPLSPENKKRLDQKFMLEFNYNSNRIEGNTLTYGQTKLLLMFGETTGDAKLRDYEEMKAHNVGLELVKREAKDKEGPLTENFIRELNRTILVEDFYKTQSSQAGVQRYQVKVGQYKTRPNSVITATGEMFDYASPEETPALMTDLVMWYDEEEAKRDLSPVQLATLFHYRYIRIHPFEDGNGRIARLLVNYILMRHNYPMIIVKSADKDKYLNVLHQCDVAAGLTPSDGTNATLEHIQPFVEYMKAQLLRAIEISIKAAKGENIEEEDDFAKRITILEREAKQKVARQEGTLYFNETQVWNVLEFCYFPIVNKLNSVLHPVEKFFNDKYTGNLISMNTGMSGSQWFDITAMDTKDTVMEKFIKEAKSIHYQFDLANTKKELNINELQIDVRFEIQLRADHYIIKRLSNKSFNYGTYPTEGEIENIVQSYKTEVLDKIEKAIHGTKQ